MSSSKFITIDISGSIFTTTSDALESIPGTRLAEIAECGQNHPSYNSKTGHYFFDRNSMTFAWILDGYRTGKLHLPSYVCPTFLKEELEYWKIDMEFLSPCCRLLFVNKTQAAWQPNDIDVQLGLGSMDMESSDEKLHLSRREMAYLFLEDPTYSTGAKIWAIIYLLFVLIAVTIQCGMTLPNWRVDVTPLRGNITGLTNPKMIMFLSTELHPVVKIIDLVCIAVFFLELVMRFVLCSSKIVFVRSVYNIIDFVSLLPMSLTFVMDKVYPKFWNNPQLFLFVYVLAALGVFRVLRLLKFARNYMGMRVLLLSLQASMREIFLLFLLIGIGTLIFSNLIYFAEFHQEDDFLNIPVGFWWAIVTMTTVGYGDKHPVSAWGYVIGAVCAISGMLCTGLPIPIIASNFNMFYTYAKTRQRTEAICRKRRMTSESCDSLRVIKNRHLSDEIPYEKYERRTSQ